MKKIFAVLVFFVIVIELRIRLKDEESYVASSSKSERTEVKAAKTGWNSTKRQLMTTAGKTSGQIEARASSAQTAHDPHEKAEASRYLPKREGSESLRYLLENLNCKQIVATRDPQCEDAYKSLESAPQQALELFSEVLELMPQKFLRERQEILGLAYNLNLDVEDRSRFYLSQTLKEVGAENSVEALLERKTAFDYYLEASELAPAQKEAALVTALQTHRNSAELQRQLIILYARIDEERAREFSRQYNLNW